MVVGRLLWPPHETMKLKSEILALFLFGDKNKGVDFNIVVNMLRQGQWR